MDSSGIHRFQTGGGYEDDESVFYHDNQEDDCFSYTYDQLQLRSPLPPRSKSRQSSGRRSVSPHMEEARPKSRQSGRRSVTPPVEESRYYKPKRTPSAVIAGGSIVGLAVDYVVDKQGHSTTETSIQSINTRISFKEHVFNLSNNHFVVYPEFLSCPNLRSLEWSAHQYVLPRGIAGSLVFGEIKILDLYNNRLTNLLSKDVLVCMPSLEQIIYRQNAICFPPVDEAASDIFNGSLEQLSLMPGFKALDLQNNDMEEFPELLCSLTSLQQLNIKDNKIDLLSLPVDGLEKLVNLKNFWFHQILTGSNKKGMVEGVIQDNNIPSLLHYLRSEKDTNQLLKVLVVGNVDAGKTTLSRSIVKHFRAQRASDKEVSSSALPAAMLDASDNVERTLTPPSDSTIGIDIRQCVVQNRNNEEIILNLWDFAGQDLYHSVHEVFFSVRMLYILVWDVTNQSVSDLEEHVHFWVGLITARVQCPIILIVATHLDGSETTLEKQREMSQFIRGELDERERKRKDVMEAALNKIGKPAEVTKSPTFLGPYFVGFGETTDSADIPGRLYDNDDFRELMKYVQDLVTPTVEKPVPFDMIGAQYDKAYNVVKTAIDSIRGSGSYKFITIEDLCQVALEQAKIEIKIEDVIEAVIFLSCRGEVVYFHNDDGTAHRDIHRIIFFEPHWLMKLIKTVLTHKQAKLADDAERVQSFRRSQSGNAIEAFPATGGGLRRDHSSHVLQRQGSQSSPQAITTVVNSRNRVLCWDDIVGMLKQENVIEETDDLKVLDTIRIVYEYYGVIIPVDYQHNMLFQFDNSIYRAEETLYPSYQDRWYILPALLEDLHSPTAKMRVFHFPSFSKLQRVFQFYSFYPRSIILKMVAEVYFGNKIMPQENKIWKDAFCQMIGDGIRSLAYITAVLDTKSPLKKLIVTAYGQCMDNSELLENLDRYCVVVTNILEKYSGSPDFQLLAFCPFCDIKSQRTDGEFKLSFDKSFKKICLSSGCESSSVVCSKGCVVSTDLVVSIVPNNFSSASCSTVDLLKMENKILKAQINFLEDEIVRESKYLALDKLPKTTCQIAMGVYNANEMKKPIVWNFSVASGCFVDVDKMKMPVVFTCDHTAETFENIFKRVVDAAALEGTHRMIFIGDKFGYYRFSAEIIFKGDSMQISREISATANDLRDPSLYDVIVLGNIMKIEPFQSMELGFPFTPIILAPATREDIIQSFNILDLSRYESSKIELQSKIVSMGYPGLDFLGLRKSFRTLSADRGRVTQVTSPDEFIARVFSEKGCSGGPALDAYTGDFVGILHGGVRKDPSLAVFFTPTRALNALRTPPTDNEPEEPRRYVIFQSDIDNLDAIYRRQVLLSIQYSKDKELYDVYQCFRKWWKASSM